MIDDARLCHDGTLEKLVTYLNMFTSTHFIAGKRFPAFSLVICVFANSLNDECVSLNALLLFAVCGDKHTHVLVTTLQSNTCACPCLLNIPTAGRLNKHFHFSPAAEYKPTTGPWHLIMPNTKIWFENWKVHSNKLKKLEYYLHEIRTKMSRQIKTAFTPEETASYNTVYCILSPLFTYNKFFGGFFAIHISMQYNDSDNLNSDNTPFRPNLTVQAKHLGWHIEKRSWSILYALSIPDGFMLNPPFTCTFSGFCSPRS